MNHALRTLRRAFTLVELLVVISIFVLLLAIAVPAFSSMLYSSEQALAEQSLRVALNTARSVAVASPTGQDSAAVFLYDSESHKTTIMICTQAGELTDLSPISQLPVSRDVFAAAPGVEPVQMSAGWTVRGLAPASSIDDDWYGDGTYPVATRLQANWLFPETSFYDDGIRNDGASRQTFMIRFEGSTGLVKLTDPKAVLVLAPSESIKFRTNWPTSPAPPGAINPYNALDETDPVRFVRRIIAAPTYLSTAQGGMTLATKQDILGDRATDTILTKPVGQIALCSENRLARALGMQVDKVTGSIYQNLTDPTFSDRNGTPFTTSDIDDVNAWIEGRLLDANNEVIDSDCRIFTLQRYLGWLQEVTGTKGGLGVGS